MKDNKLYEACTLLDLIHELSCSVTSALDGKDIAVAEKVRDKLRETASLLTYMGGLAYGFLNDGKSDGVLDAWRTGFFAEIVGKIDSLTGVKKE